jgi:hypothetical protein
VCCVLFERAVLFCVICVFYVLYLTIVPLPPDKNPFAIQVNNKKNKSNSGLETTWTV